MNKIIYQDDHVKVAQTKKAGLVGTYNSTSNDKEKAESNRLTCIDGKYKTVWIAAKGESLTIIGKRAWNKWAKNNEYVCDF